MFTTMLTHSFTYEKNVYLSLMPFVSLKYFLFLILTLGGIKQACLCVRNKKFV